jgi:hypothetical protein
MRVAATLILILSVGIPQALAADTRFQHVALLAASDRVSVVFELTGEPRDVATRRVSAAVLELDAGPVVMPAKATSFMAPPGVRFVMGVSVQGAASAAGARLKARITLLERARSAVRVVGRRVYVDFSAEPAPAAAAPTPQQKRPTAANADVGRSAPASVPAVQATPPATARETYRATVQPAIERFEQLTPFLLSAVVSPSDSVLKAIGNTLIGIQGLLITVDVPGESKQAHDVLSLAVTTATKAVDPMFNGDRSAQAKQALALLDQAKASW